MQSQLEVTTTIKFIIDGVERKKGNDKNPNPDYTKANLSISTSENIRWGKTIHWKINIHILIARSAVTSWQGRAIPRRPFDSTENTNRQSPRSDGAKAKQRPARNKIEEEGVSDRGVPIDWARCWTRIRWRGERSWGPPPRRGRSAGERWGWELWCSAGQD